MRSSNRIGLPAIMVAICLMTAASINLSFAAQPSDRNLQKAPGECGVSISDKLVEQAHSIIIKLDSKGKITYFNKFAQDFFGFHEKEVVGKNLVGTIAPKRESSGRDLQPILEDVVRHPERHVTNTNENITHNGKHVLVSWINLPITDNHGVVTEILCIGNPVGNGIKQGLATAPGKD